MATGNNNRSVQYTYGNWRQPAQPSSPATPVITATCSAVGSQRRKISGIRHQTYQPIQPTHFSTSNQAGFTSVNNPAGAARTTAFQNVRQSANNGLSAASKPSAGLAVAPPFVQKVPASQQPHPSGNARKSPPAACNGTETNSVPASGADTVEVEEDEDIIMVCDKGANPLYPFEPKLSSEFKEYLVSLCSQDPGKIKALEKAIPKMLEKFPERPAKKSYCFVTVEDLQYVQEEVDRFVNNWTIDEQCKLAEDMDCTIQLLSFHEYLVSHVLAAKKRCIKNEVDRIKEQQQLQLSVEGGDLSREDRENLADFKGVNFSLDWQAGVFRNMYRQTLRTPFMEDKRRSELGLQKTTGSKGGSTASQGETRKSRASRKTPAAKKAKVSDMSQQASN